MKKYTRVEMREMMEVRVFSPKTVEIYINQVRNLAEYIGKPPHKVTPEGILQFQVFLVHEKQVCWSTFNQAVCGMRFFLILLLAMTGQSSTYPFKKSTAHSL